MNTTQKSDLVASVIKVVWIGSALALGSVLLKSSSRRSESFGASPKRSSKLMTEKAAINALTTAKGKFMTVTFLKKDGSTRRMRCRTGVKRYVKGVGSPLGTPANRLQKYKLITVYDLDKAGYRSIPVDRVVSVKAAGKTYSSKNPKGKQMSAEEYNSYNAEWEAIFDVYGRRGYFADLPDKLTEERTEDEILDMIMDESDHPEWEEVDEMIPQGIEKHDAESEETDCAVCVKPFYTSMDGSRCLGCDEMFCDDHYDIDEEMCMSCCESLEAESFEAPYAGGGALMDIGKDTALGSFSPSELATSSAIHGDFDQASLNYSGKQNLEVRAESDEATKCGDCGRPATHSARGGTMNRCDRCWPGDDFRAESDREEDEEDYEQYLRLQGLCECTACGDISDLTVGTTDKQGLYRCASCLTKGKPSITDVEIMGDTDYLRGTY